jgi:hypothetical protein
MCFDPLPLKNRRQEYSWAFTGLRDFKLVTDRKSYHHDDIIQADVVFRLVGGLRESFHPDVWTVAWEDFDKRLRLTFGVELSERKALTTRKLAELKKSVRIASFYWSRDPDLPHRIWAMIMNEDGSAPQVPTSVEDAKARMFDIAKRLEVPARSMGRGSHSLVASAHASWGRRSFIEKGSVAGRSNQVAVSIE